MGNSTRLRELVFIGGNKYFYSDTIKHKKRFRYIFFAIFSVIILIGSGFSIVISGNATNHILDNINEQNELNQNLYKYHELINNTLNDMESNGSHSTSIENLIEENEIKGSLENIFSNIVNKTRNNDFNETEYSGELKGAKRVSSRGGIPTWIVYEDAPAALQFLLASILNQEYTSRDIKNHSGEKFRILFETISEYVGFDLPPPTLDVTTGHNNVEIKNVWLSWLGSLNNSIATNSDLSFLVKNYLWFILDVFYRTIEIIGDNYDTSKRMVPGDIIVSYFIPHSDTNDPFDKCSYLNITLPYPPGSGTTFTVVKIFGYGASLLNLPVIAFDVLVIETKTVSHQIIFRVGGSYKDINGDINVIYSQEGENNPLNINDLDISELINVEEIVFVALIFGMVEIEAAILEFSISTLVSVVSKSISTILLVYNIYDLYVNFGEKRWEEKVLSGIGIAVGVIGVCVTIAEVATLISAGIALSASVVLAVVGIALIIIGIIADWIWGEQEKQRQKAENEQKYEQAKDDIRLILSKLSTTLMNEYQYLEDSLDNSWEPQIDFFTNSMYLVAHSFSTSGYGRLKHTTKALEENFLYLGNKLADVATKSSNGMGNIADAIEEIVNPAWDNADPDPLPQANGCWLWGLESKKLNAVLKSGSSTYFNQSVNTTVIQKETDQNWFFKSQAVDYVENDAVYSWLSFLPAKKTTDPPEVNNAPHNFRTAFIPTEEIREQSSSSPIDIEVVHNQTTIGEDINSGIYVHFNSPGHTDIDIEGTNENNEPSAINDWEVGTQNRWIESLKGEFYQYKYLAVYPEAWPILDQTTEEKLQGWFDDISTACDKLPKIFDSINDSVQEIGSNFVEEFFNKLQIPKICDTKSPDFKMSEDNVSITLHGKVVKRPGDDVYNRSVFFYVDDEYHARATDYKHIYRALRDGSNYQSEIANIDLTKTHRYRIAVVDGTTFEDARNPDNIIVQGQDLIMNAKPVADFTWRAYNSDPLPSEGQPIVFDASESEGSSLTYNWDFAGRGNGEEKTFILWEGLPEGNYDITLIVIDNRGLTDKITKEITILESNITLGMGIDNLDYAWEQEWKNDSYTQLLTAKGKWVGEYIPTDPYVYDNDCIQTTAIGHQILGNGQTLWERLRNKQLNWASFYTIVQGPVNVTFKFRVSSPILDTLELWAGGECVFRKSGWLVGAIQNIFHTNTWREVTIPIWDTGNITLRWLFRTTPLYDPLTQNIYCRGCAWIDHIRITQLPAVSLIDGLETNISSNKWSHGCSGGTIGNYRPANNWSGQGEEYCDGFAGHDVYSAQSGSIPDNGTTWVQATVEGKGTISFWCKTSSEKRYLLKKIREKGDYLRFYIDGKEVLARCGNNDWTYYSYFIPDEGSHTLKWSYEKDHSFPLPGKLSPNLPLVWKDKVWLDHVIWEQQQISSLQQGVDNEQYQFTTFGNAQWYKVTNIYHTDGDAVRSGAIGNNQNSVLKTYIPRAGYISFWWKVDSLIGDDLRFWVDDVLIYSITGQDQSWQQIIYYVDGDGTHKLEWEYKKNLILQGGSDCGWVDDIQIYNYSQSPTTELSEGVDSDKLTFLTYGDSEWFKESDYVYYDGDAIQSGGFDEYIIKNGRWSATETHIEGPGKVSFYWAVHSKPRITGGDALIFEIDGVEKNRITGVVPWTYKEYWITSPGAHTLTWWYKKDLQSLGDNLYSDCGWIDKVEVSCEYPYAQFTWVPKRPNVNEEITFDGSASYDLDGGSIANYAWDFNNDGTYDATGQTVTHVYTTTGWKTIKLKVTDDEGLETTWQKQVHILPVIARFERLFRLDNPQNVSFDASSSISLQGQIVNYEWDWNNDGTYDEIHPTPYANFSWLEPGGYKVTLRVTDNLGESDIVTNTTYIGEVLFTEDFNSYNTLFPVNGWSQSNLSNGWIGISEGLGNDGVVLNEDVCAYHDIDVTSPNTTTGRGAWDIQYCYDVANTTGGAEHTGAEFDGSHFFTTRWNENKIFSYNPDGSLNKQFTISGVSEIRDLAWDGQYMYGSNATNTIYIMDFENEILVGTITSPVIVRSIAYDSDHDAFWVNNWDTTLTLINRYGTILNTIPNPPSLYGSAYDNISPGGPYLWIFTGTSTGEPCQVEQYDIANKTLNGVVHSVSGDFGSTGIAGGLFFTTEFKPGTATLGGLMQYDPHDILFGYEVCSGLIHSDLLVSPLLSIPSEGATLQFLEKNKWMNICQGHTISIAYADQNRGEQNLFTSEDTYINQHNPTTNYGSSTNFVIADAYGEGGSSNWRNDGLIRFNISSIPAGTSISSAKLYFYYYNYWDTNPVGREIDCRRVTNPWNEMTVTWNTRPTYTSTVTDTVILPSTPGHWVEWNITEDVIDFINGVYPNYGWDIMDVKDPWGTYNIPQQLYYSSDYSDSTYHPYLEISGFSQTSEIANFTEHSGEWTTRNVNLSAYAGQDIYVIFNYTGGTSSEWYIDNVELIKGVPPNKPSQLSGKTLVGTGPQSIENKYTTTTIDPDNDSLYYMVDWDDNSILQWHGPYESGFVISQFHNWNEPGVYNIKVKAKDTTGLETDWSDSLTVTVGTILLSETFDGSWPPIGWTIENASKGWESGQTIDVGINMNAVAPKALTHYWSQYESDFLPLSNSGENCAGVWGNSEGSNVEIYYQDFEKWILTSDDSLVPIGWQVWQNSYDTYNAMPSWWTKVDGSDTWHDGSWQYDVTSAFVGYDPGSGYNESVEMNQNEWLMFRIDLTKYTNVRMTHRAFIPGDNTQSNNEHNWIKISDDYTGDGNPNTATWEILKDYAHQDSPGYDMYYDEVLNVDIPNTYAGKDTVWIAFHRYCYPPWNDYISIWAVDSVRIIADTIDENQDEWIITPPVDCTNQENVYLSFYGVWDWLQVDPQHFDVLVSTDGGSSWDTVIDIFNNQTYAVSNEYDTVFSGGPGGDGWCWNEYKIILDISDYAAGEPSVQIAWRAYKSFDGRLSPVADTYLNQHNPTTNYGSSTNFVIADAYGGGGSSNWRNDGLIRFNISSIPAGTSISSAKLYFYYYNYWDTNPVGREIDCRRVTNPWNEMTVTWNTRPTYASTVTDTVILPSTPGHWVEWNVTEDVIDFINGVYPNYGWDIMDVKDPWGTYNMPQQLYKSNDDQDMLLRPYLQIETANGRAATDLAMGTIESFIMIDDVVVAAEPISPPEITTQSESDITATSARLSCTVNSLKGADEIGIAFSYDTTSHASNNIKYYNYSSQIETVNAPGLYTIQLNNLTEDTTYYFRAVAYSYGGSYVSIYQRQFTTLARTPLVSTAPATHINLSGATLHGQLDRVGAVNTSVWFVWDTTSHTNYWEYLYSTPTITTSVPDNFTAILNGLNPGQTYHYRAVASNNAGSHQGNDMTITIRQSIPLATALDTTDLVWTTGGNASWFGQTTYNNKDTDAAESGDITDNEESWIQTTIQGPCVLSFEWKVSSEEKGDYLRCYIDELEQKEITGDTGWNQVSLILNYGQHTARWTYQKEYTTSSGNDCGWIDNITYYNTPPNSPAFPNPLNNSINCDTYTFLKCNVSDPDGHSLNVTFYWENGTIIRTFTNVTRRTVSVFPGFLEFNSSYRWYVIIDDGEFSVRSSTWKFTTKSAPWINTAPTISSPSPTNTSTSMNRYHATNVTVADVNTNQTLTVCFWNNKTGSWVKAQQNNSVSPLSTVVKDVNASWCSNYSRKYWWKVTVYDGRVNSSVIYTFTTKSNIIAINISFCNGWNLITVPVDYDWWTSNLAKNISGCQMVSRFDAVNQTFKTYIVGGPPSFDFPIMDGYGYFVLVNQSSNVSLSGIRIDTVSVPLSVGWNMIGWYHASETLASTLGGAISGCQMISRFDGVSQSFKTFIVGGPPSFDFTVKAGMGLFVLVNTASTWRGEG